MLPTSLYIYKEALSALQNNKVFTYLCACLISSSLPPGKLLGALPRMLNNGSNLDERDQIVWSSPRSNVL